MGYKQRENNLTHLFSEVEEANKEVKKKKGGKWVTPLNPVSLPSEIGIFLLVTGIEVALKHEREMPNALKLSSVLYKSCYFK